MLRPRLAIFAVLVTSLLLGCRDKSRARKHAAPAHCPDRISVSVTYPGASPQQVEQGLILAIEEAVRGIANVTSVQSTARDSTGVVTLSLAPGDPYATLAHVTQAVDRITTFPENAERPIATVLPQSSEFLLVALYGDIDERTLVARAHALRRDLLAEPGIHRVELLGTPERELRVRVAPDMLMRYGLTLAEFERAVRDAAVGSDRLLRTADALPDLSRAPLRRGPDGAVITLADIATLEDALADSPRARYRGASAAALLVSGQPGKRAAPSAPQSPRAPAPPPPPKSPTPAWIERATEIARSVAPAMNSAVHGPIGLSRCPPGAPPELSGPVIVTDIRLSIGVGSKSRAQTAQWIASPSDQADELVLLDDGLAGGPVFLSGPMTIEIVSFPSEPRDTSEVAAGLRARTNALPGAEAAVVRGPGERFVRVQLTHPDTAVLGRAVQTLEQLIQQHPASLSTYTDHVASKSIVDFALSREARVLGVTEHDVAHAIRAHRFGTEIARVMDRGQELRVVLRVGDDADGQTRPLGDAFAGIQVRTPSGASVPLTQLGKTQISNAEDHVIRIDSRRSAHVIAIVGGDRSSAAALRKAITSDYRDTLRASYPAVKLSIR